MNQSNNVHVRLAVKVSRVANHTHDLHIHSIRYDFYLIEVFLVVLHHRSFISFCQNDS